MKLRPVVYMLCGPVCVGKSTWVEKNIVIPYYVASTDALIEEAAKAKGLTYNDVFKDEIGAATARMNDWIVASILVDKDIVWDQTNLTPKVRKNKMKVFDGSDYRRIAIAFVDADKNIIMERNQARPGKVIPENVIDSMLANYVVPTLEDEPWFDEIRYVNAHSGEDVVQ